MSALPRVILAGGKAGPELAAQIQSPVRALALFQGKRLLDHVLDALLDADRFAPVTVVGDVPESRVYACVPDRGDFVSNLLAGVDSYRAADWVLVSSADMPFLTGTVISRFVDDALTAAIIGKVDIVYPIVPVSACYAKYPGIKRTAIKLREGEFTGGNLVLARPSFFLDRRELLGRAYAARKEPFRLAWMLGLDTVARLAISQLLTPQALDVKVLEQRVGRLIQGKVAALISPCPELATDLDRASDFVGAANLDRVG